MREAGVLLNMKGEPMYWHNPHDRSGGALPDSRDLWNVIWDNREDVSGFVHSHPGSGVPGPSYEDVTTFSGIERALGKRLDWWIITEDACSFIRWVGPHMYDYAALPVRQKMLWMEELRRNSEMTQT